MNSSCPPSEEKLYALVQEAFSLHEKNNLLEAEKKYLQFLSHASDVWLIHYNLGLLYFDLSHYDRSIEHYNKALGLTRDNPDIYFNLAICLKQCHRYEEAITLYESALEIEPDDIDCLYNLAGCYMAAGSHVKASECYCDLLSKKPDHESALNNLAYLYHKNGNKEKALQHYSRLLKINPSHESASHMINALQGIPSPSAPSSYIRDIFDQYSDHYEHSLVNRLEYRLPEQLFAFAVACAGSDCFGSTLDLGCGTGLSGEAFRKSCTVIDGIDISDNMLAKARVKGFYRHLWNGEIATVLSSPLSEKYNLVVAADVFAYFGELDTVFCLTADTVAAEGLFFFSVETIDDGKSDAFVLQDSGRFSHSDGYIRKTAEKNGWVYINSRALNLRKERNSWIQGMIYGFRRKRFN